MFSFIASLAPTAKMLPSPDTDTEDPKRERYTLLSMESDMTYGDDKSSSEEDDNEVSFIAMVELAEVAFIAYVPSDDDNAVSFIAKVELAADALIATVPLGDDNEVSFIAMVALALVAFIANVPFIIIEFGIGVE